VFTRALEQVVLKLPSVLLLSLTLPSLLVHRHLAKRYGKNEAEPRAIRQCRVNRQGGQLIHKLEVDVNPLGAYMRLTPKGAETKDRWCNQQLPSGARARKFETVYILL
jgi:hypothetical protein